MTTVRIAFLIALLTMMSRAQSPGGSWTVTPTPNPAGATQVILRDVSAVGPQDVWAVGYYRMPSFAEKSLAMHWNGAAWTIVPTPSPAPYPGGVEFVHLEAVEARGPNDVWAAGTQKIPGPGGFIGQQLFVIHWDGNSWTEVPTPLTPSGNGAVVQDIEDLAANDLLFVGSTVVSTGGLNLRAPLAMHWDGSSFSFDSTPVVASLSVTHEYNAVTALSPTDLWAAGRVGFGATCGLPRILDHGDGASWTPATTPAPGLTHCLDGIDAVATNDVWAVGTMNVGGSIQVLTLHWDGTGWTYVPAPGGGGAVLALAANDVLMGGAGIYQWAGATWSLVHPFAGGAFVRALTRVDANGDIWAVGQQGGASASFAARRSAPPAPSWQVNRPEATFTIDGGVNTPTSGPIYTTGSPGQTLTVSVSSTLVGHPWDIVVSLTPPQPAVAITPTGQIFNIDLAAPGLGFLLGGFSQPMPAGGYAVPLTPPAGVLVFVGQMVVLDAAHPDGAHFSAANDLVSF